jgi:hypothetical protein
MFWASQKLGPNVYAGFCGFSRVFGAKNRKHGLVFYRKRTRISGATLLFCAMSALPIKHWDFVGVSVLQKNTDKEVA